MKNLTRKGRRWWRRNRVEVVVLAAMLGGTIAGMYLLTNNANGYRISEKLAQDVDLSNVCYFDDEPYYHEYVSAAAIPLMTLDKQSDDAPAELLDDEVLAVFHGFPWAEPNPAPYPHNPLDYRRSHVPDWMARGPLAQWFGGYGLKNSIGRNQHGVPCEVVIGRVDAPPVTTMMLIGLAAMFLMGRKRWVN